LAEIGVDYGRERTGFAVHISGVVLPLDPLTGSTWEGIFARLQAIQAENGKGNVVIGLPLSAGGRPTELSREVEGLAGFLRQKGFHVELARETGSSLEAGGTMGTTGARDGRDDSLSAMVILKRYLGIP
jgi:putative Holliday junction resolvase